MKRNLNESQLREVKTAGFKETKRDKSVNRRAGLHDKKNKSGEARVKRSKPLGLKHVRRMRKAALALSLVFVGGAAAVGVGFFSKAPVEELSENEYLTVCYEAPSEGSPEDYTVVENIGYMNYVLQSQPYWSSEMSSQVHTVIPQVVHTYKKYYNGVLISADISEGASTEANQFCVAEGVVLWRSSVNKNFNGMETEWSQKAAEGLKIQDFKKKRGLPPSEFSVYVLNENTILNAQDKSVTKNADGTFTMSLALNVNSDDDAASADYYYKQQMYVTGGLDERPTILETTLTYVFDSDWRVLSFDISDTYKAKMGISVTCTSDTHTDFNYEEKNAVNSYYDDYFVNYISSFTVADDKESEPNPLNYLAEAFGSVLTDGAIFNVDLAVDDLQLGGSVYVGLKKGNLDDVRVKLEDISLYIDSEKTLYFTDGNAKYKMPLGGLFAKTADEQSTGGLDISALTDELTSGVFETYDGGAFLSSKLNVFGIDVALNFTFNVTENGVSLGDVKAEIPVGGKVLKAKLAFGTDGDIPQIPDSLSDYADVMNGGLSLKTLVSADGFKLDGIVSVVINQGTFGGIRAEFGNLGVYYVSPENMLYLTDCNVGYKVSLSGISFPSGTDFDYAPVLSQVIENLKGADGTLSTNAEIEILRQTVGAALAVQLVGGINVNANISALGHNLTVNVALTNETVELPDFENYVDILNEGINLNVSLTLDELKLNGLVYVGLSEGNFTELRADFSEIEVYYSENVLYFTDGNVKYKVAIPQSESGLAIDFDIKSLVNEVLGSLAFTENKISASANLELFEQIINAAVKITLNDGINVNANVSALGHEISANVSLTNETVELPDFENYVDILNEGINLNVSLTLDELELNGLVYVGLSEGKFTELRADFGEIEVYYKENVLYFTDGNVKYKFAIPQSESGLAIDFDIKSLVNEVLGSLAFTENKISASANLELFEQIINAVANITLNDGIKVNANVSALGHEISVNISLTDEKVELPDFEEYTDVLNEGINLNVSVKLDGLELNGKVFVGLNEGNFTELRADFGDIKVYYENITRELYIACGDVKLKVAIKEQNGANLDISGFLPSDISGIVVELLNNLVAATDEISSNANFTVMDAVVPVSARISLKDGISAEAETMLLGINLKASVGFETQSIPALSEADKAEYTDILKDSWKFVENLVGSNVALDVSGKLYSYDNSKYAQYGYEKYEFKALLEYDFHPESEDTDTQAIQINTGTVDEDGVRKGVDLKVDSEVYLHFNLLLAAKSTADDSLYLDVIVIDANPVTNGKGVTSGGYTKDGVLDVYLAVSKYAPYDAKFEPVYIYADMDEIMTLVSMAGAMANLDNLSFKDNEELNGAVREISGIIDELLIGKYIPNTRDQFASLGDSLIPQILKGKSLNEFLEELLTSLENNTKVDGETRKFILSDKYVESLSYGNDSLKLVLNSSVVYNREINPEDNLVAEIFKGDFGGVTKLSGISLKNVYFGEDNVNELDMDLDINYGEISKPEKTNGLKGYMNFKGLETFLATVVNSSTHESASGEQLYELNHYYLLNGSITANISIIGIINVDVTININSLSIRIDENNKVSADVHLSYAGKKVLVTAIDGSCDVYLSIKNDMVYIKRIKTTDARNNKLSSPVTETRIMPLADFSANIMNHINFIFNFGSVIADELNKIDMSNGSSVDFSDSDFGTVLKSVLAYYTHSETETGASWTMAVSGDILSKLVGMTMSDIPVTFSADKNDGILTLKGLDIAKSTMKLATGVTLEFYGKLDYCNPNEKIIQNADGSSKYTDSSVNLVSFGLSEINGLSWKEVLGGENYKDISKNTNWNLLKSDTGLSYLSYGDGSNLAVGTLAFKHASDFENTSFEEFGTRQTVLYNKATNKIYTRFTAPVLSGYMPESSDKTAVWESAIYREGDLLVARAVYDFTYTVTIDSRFEIDENYAVAEDGTWRRVVEKAYKQVLLRKDVLFTDIDGSVYGLKGYRAGESGEEYSFGGTALDDDGYECFVLEVSGDLIIEAVWERVYAVEFEGAGVRYYYEGEVLIPDNMPEIPYKKGYSGYWVGAEGTVIEKGSSYRFEAVYEIESYTVKIISTQAVTAEGFVADENGYVNSKSYEYGFELSLNDLDSVSPAYIFGGIYDNAEYEGEPVTQITVESNTSYYVKWIGKKINVTYKSDLQFGNSKIGTDGYEAFETVFVYGNADEQLASFVLENKELLGWFVQVGDTYSYVSSAQELKARYENSMNGVESINLTLWAVWIEALQVNITNCKNTAGFWSIGGNYSGCTYSSDMSKTVAESAGVTKTVRAQYELNDSAEHTDKAQDTIGGGWFTLKSSTFSKSGMTSAKQWLSYAGARIKVTYNLGGEEKVYELSAYKKK